MSTVDKKSADNIVANNGYYDGDSDNTLGDNPRIVSITKFTNAWAGVSYGCTFEGERNVYLQPTKFIIDPTPYWIYHAPA